MEVEASIFRLMPCSLCPNELYFSKNTDSTARANEGTCLSSYFLLTSSSLLTSILLEWLHSGSLTRITNLHFLLSRPAQQLFFNILILEVVQWDIRRYYKFNQWSMKLRVTKWIKLKRFKVFFLIKAQKFLCSGLVLIWFLQHFYLFCWRYCTKNLVNRFQIANHFRRTSFF